MKDGVIADFTATQLLIKNIITKVSKRYNAGKTRVVVGVPSGITEVEERAVEEAISQAGAKEVYLIEEPMAAAIGSGIDVVEPTGSMIIDIGGGTTEVAVISLGGIVISDSIKIAGDEIDDAIVNYIKNNLNLAIGNTEAEKVKIELGCAIPSKTEKTMEIRGRELTTGLPENKVITSNQVQEAMYPLIEKIIELVKATLEKTPPELASDIVERGITLAGGGALIKDIDVLISQKTNIPVYIATNPLECVANGTGKIIEDIEKLRTALINRKR
jgi:rod shape-determining protein MreB